MHSKLYSLCKLRIEPVVFNNSHFGNGQYPIVYSNIKCGGWENKLDDCEKDQHLNFECSAHSTAGLLCGYGKF